MLQNAPRRVVQIPACRERKVPPFGYEPSESWAGSMNDNSDCGIDYVQLIEASDELNLMEQREKELLGGLQTNMISIGRPHTPAWFRIEMS